MARPRSPTQSAASSIPSTGEQQPCSERRHWVHECDDVGTHPDALGLLHRVQGARGIALRLTDPSEGGQARGHGLRERQMSAE